MTSHRSSNLPLLRLTYADAIKDILPYDSTGRPSDHRSQRATIVFVDDTKLYVTEILHRGNIEVYYYDRVERDGHIKAQFHSEPHPNDRRYQTKTEPFHIHPPKNTILSNQTRYPNYAHQELFNLVEGIFLFHILPNRTPI